MKKRTKQKKETEKLQAKSGRRNKRLRANRTGKLKNKLIGAFLVPVALIILLGVISYQLARTNLIREYRNSASSTMSAMGMYCEQLCKNVENKANELVNNEIVQSYYKKHAGATDSAAMDVYRKAESAVKTGLVSSNDVANYVLFSEKGNAMTGASGVVPADFYAQYLESAEGSGFAAEKSRIGAWSGTHDLISQTIGVSEDSYAISYTQRMVKGKGFLVIDIKNESILNMLGQMSDEGSVSALLTPDGREIRGDGANEETFLNQSFTQTVMSAKEAGNEMVAINGEDYLLLYTPVGNTGMVLCGAIPDSTILKTASTIGRITIFIVALAILISLLIGSVLAGNISGEVRRLIGSMEKISQGDLTAQFSSKRKDEFKNLTIGMTDMLESMRHMISDMKQFCTHVGNSSGDVSAAAAHMDESIRSINEAMAQVAEGVANQAMQTEQSLNRMNEFSEELNLVSQGAEEIQINSDSAIAAVKSGEQMVADLSEKAQAATQIARSLVGDIEEVNARSEDINGFMGVISSLAEQTNLLSLNASIEAARAGEAGKGFAVVAEEIRKLSEETKEAGSRINQIVADIQKTTQNTTASAKRAEEFLQSQSDSIEGTVLVLGDIAHNVESLVTVLRTVTARIDNMVQGKNEVLDAIGSIAACSEQEAASTEHITASVSGQAQQAKKLLQEAVGLEESVRRLEMSMDHFVVDKNA